MGLDMYLYKKSKDGKPVKKYYGGPEEEEHSYEIPGHEIAYWRKVNQVHNWFVTNVQNGVDECQESDVSYDQLVVLYKVCRQALVDRNAELIPPCDGFFFGGAKVDEWYWHGLIDTCEALRPILDSGSNDKFVYRSSW